MKNENLITARKKRGFTQKQVAQKVGITEVSYQRYEYGTQKPSLEMAILLSRLLGKSVEDLWGNAPPVTQATFSV